jgi:hypothetical protein
MGPPRGCAVQQTPQSAGGQQTPGTVPIFTCSPPGRGGRSCSREMSDGRMFEYPPAHCDRRYRMPADSEGVEMFGKRGGMNTRAKRDAEWRLLVRSITNPDHVPSEADEAQFRAYLGELGAPRRGRRGPRITDVADDRPGLDRQRG